MLFLVLEFSFQALYFNLQLDVLKSTQALTVSNCHRPSVLEPGSYLSLALVHSFSSYPRPLHDPWHKQDPHGSVTTSRMNGLYSLRISPEQLICSPKPFILAPGWWKPPKSVCFLKHQRKARTLKWYFLTHINLLLKTKLLHIELYFKYNWGLNYLKKLCCKCFGK